MRLARDQEHAQVLAHAFRRDHGAVVGGRELAGCGIELDFENVLAGVRERHVDRDRPSDGGGHVLVGLSFAADLERDCLGSAVALAGFAHHDLDVA